MLNHSTIAGESSRIILRRIAATKGNRPNIRFSRMYLPVRCMTQLSNVSDVLKVYTGLHVNVPGEQRSTRYRYTIGNEMRAYENRNQHGLRAISNQKHAPASLALVSITVWNHVGKLYMTEKLHVATRKLLMPTRTGIFCFRRNGASTGSGAT